MLQTVAEEVFALLGSESLQVPIARVYKLEEIQEAHEFMESRQHQGKILIKV